jgi:chromosome segregation ATPase
MESGKPPIDPSLALINDEILSTQVRLMELYVKQAQATAANESARTHERLQAELAELQAELEQKNLALEKQKALSHQPERGRKADLRARPLPGQRLLEARETDLGTTDALRQRIAQLESTIQKAQLTTEIEAARARETWQAELTALKGELERKESPLPVVQRSLDEVEGTLGTEIQDLRGQLAAKVELLEHRTAELQNARTQIALLQQRIQQLELTGAQTEEAASEGTRIRKTLQAELVALRTAFEQKDLALQQNHTAAAELERRLNSQLRGLQSQLAEKQGLLETRSQEIGELIARINDLQEQIARLELVNEQTVEQAQSAARTLQDGLRARLQELEATVSEKADLLRNRTTELESAQAEIALLRERMTQLELNSAQSKAAAIEAGRSRETLQAELVMLRTAVEQKNLLLQQTHAATRQLDERLNAQLHDLQSQLEEKHGLLETRSQEIGELTTRINDLQEQIARLELANEQTVEQAQSAARTLQDGLRARLQELEATVSEKADLLQNRTTELESAQAETALLRERVQQLELNGAQTKAEAIEAIRIRETLQAELVVLRTAVQQKDSSLQQTHAASRELEERLDAQLHNLQSQLEEKHGLLETRSQEIGELTTRINDLQEQIALLELANKQTVEQAHSAARTLQDGFRARLQELEATVSEKADLLRNRTAELESVQAETALLRDRITQLELRCVQAEAGHNKTERIREGLQNQLATAQRALEHKNASLAQREAEFKESGDRLSAQLNDVKNQLAEKQQILDVKNGDLDHAAKQIAGLEERIAQLQSLHAEVQAAAATEVDRVRRESQSERAALQTSLREKEQALQERRGAIAELEANLNGQIQDLRNRLIEKQELLERRDHEFNNLGSETALLRENIAQLESAAYQAQQSAAAEAERIRAELQAKLAALEAQLKEKDHQLAQNQAGVRESEGQLQIQLHNLEIQIAEKQLLLETRNIEMSSLQDQLSTVSERIIQLESANQQTIAAASLDAEIAQQRFDAELAARQEELRSIERAAAAYQTQASELQQSFNVRLRDLETQLVEKQELLETRRQEISELTAKTSDLQEQIICLELANKQTVKEANAAARALEDSLRARVQELEAAVSEKAQGLQNRRQELENAQSETAALRRRIEQLELARAQTEEAKNEADRVRDGLQNELNNVQRALEQKNARLAQREAEFKESSEQIQAQLSELQNQRSEERAALENQTHELRSTQSEITALRDKIEELESAKLAADTNASAAINRLREQYQLELASMRAELEEREIALEERQRSLRVLEEKLNSQIHQLENQLAEKQSLLDRGHLQLQEKGSEISALQQEIARSEFARRQTEMLAATQAEQIRERVKAEVEAMDDQLREKENALKSLADRGQELESRIDDLRQQLAQKESLIESRNIEATDLRTQADDLLGQITHMEQAHEQALQQQQVAAGQLEQNHRVQVHELQNQLTEKLTLLETRNKEVQALESKVTDLVDRIDRSEVAVEQARATAASEIEQMRRQSEAELTARQAEVERKVGELQDREAALYAAEQNFKGEIDALRTEVAEKRFLLENRNEQLLQVKMEADELQDRIVHLESAVKQVQGESLNRSERTGEYTRTALDRLWEKEERQAAANDLEQGFQAEIDELRSELAEKQALLENPSKDFLIGDPTITAAQKEKLSRLEQLVETIKADNEQTLISPHNRKWRFSLGRKRRWKF